MSDGYEAINDVLRGTVIHSPTAFSWFGRRSPSLPAKALRSLGPEVAAVYLRSQLSSQLYRDFYCQGYAGRSTDGAGNFEGPGREQFVARLAAVNSGVGCWTDGWRLRSRDEEYVVVEREGLNLVATPHDVMSRDGDGDGGVRLRLPNESISMLPGFYLAIGDAELARGTPVVRLYWNLMAEGAEPLIRRATAELNRAGLPFRLKVLDSPARYNRCDAGVLYVRIADYPAVADIVAGIYPDVANWLKTRTPAFTKVLAPGLGLAEDPGPGESFGQHRCRLLAEGLVRAYERRTPARHRLPVVTARFDEAGISLDAPYLNTGSDDRYALPAVRHHLPMVSAPMVSTNAGRPAAPGEVDPDRLLAAAARIGRRFVDDAVWHGDRCNWISLAPTDTGPSAPSSGSTYHAMGPTIYGGSSGVAMFLAQLHAATGDDAVRRTAAAAFRQALSRADTVPPDARLGLFTGWAGIALTAATAAVSLGEPALLEGARSLVDRYRREGLDEAEFDIIMGKAGAVLMFLMLRDVLDAPEFAAEAVRLGDRLVDTADETEAGLSWSTSSYPTLDNLNGFSHGAAGAAYALLELFAATGDERYRHTAEGAFRYERSWFDEGQSNWPNLLDDPNQPRGRRNGPYPYMTAWCHGAPGIALSRLRAYQLLGDEALYKEATVALRTTHDAVSNVLRSQTGNFSLCHGLAGNADILLHGWQVLGSDFAQGRTAAHEVALTGIEQYGERDRAWPCLDTGEESLPLMFGIAGVGQFYLRLRDPAGVSSVLMLRPER